MKKMSNNKLQKAANKSGINVKKNSRKRDEKTSILLANKEFNLA